MKNRKAGNIFIGISGWRYPPWRGVFYPPELRQRSELEYASRQFKTIEINGSFYSLQRPENYATWHDMTPDDFVFAVKGGRYITHLRRLKDVEKPLANFFASGVLNLGKKMGPFLWQFPPNFIYREELFENFFKLLPADTEAMVKLARKREQRMAGRARLATDVPRRVRHAVEIRHASFISETFIQQLRQYGIGLVVADTAGKWPFLEDVTADFVYIRLHGDEELYVSGYTEEALDCWAERIRAWTSGGQPVEPALASGLPPAPAGSRDVYCYFDNDVKVRAPVDARRLAAKLGIGPHMKGMPEEGLFAAPAADLAAFSKVELAPRWNFRKSAAKRNPAGNRDRPASKR